MKFAFIYLMIFFSFSLNLMGQNYYNLRIVGEVFCNKNKIKKGKIRFFDDNTEDAKPIKLEDIRNGKFDASFQLRIGYPLLIKVLYDKREHTFRKHITSDEETIILEPLELCEIINIDKEEESKKINIRTYETEYVNVRSRPNSKSERLFVARSGDTYELLDTSENTQKIEWIIEDRLELIILEDHWYYVKELDSEQTGWVFGGLTSIGTSPHRLKLILKIQGATNIYAGPSIKSSFTGIINERENVEVYSTVNINGEQWYQIKIIDENFALIGWIKDNIQINRN